MKSCTEISLECIMEKIKEIIKTLNKEGINPLGGDCANYANALAIFAGIKNPIYICTFPNDSYIGSPSHCAILYNGFIWDASRKLKDDGKNVDKYMKIWNEGVDDDISDSEYVVYSETGKDMFKEILNKEKVNKIVKIFEKICDFV